MYEGKRKEIDLVDLIIDWMSHWRSFLVFMLIGIVLAGGYYVRGSKAAAKINSEGKEVAVETLAEHNTLSQLTSEQLETVTTEDMEKYFLSEKDVKAVDEVIELYQKYRENVDEYESQKDTLEIKDRTEAFNYIANSKNLIEARRGNLSADQQVYYYAKLGLSSEIGANSELKEQSSSQDTYGTVKVSKKKTLLLVILAIIFHFVIVATKYIFNNKIKHSDDLKALTNVSEYTRAVDWEKINSKNFLDRLVNRIRFSSTRKTAYSDVLEINALTTIEMLKNKQYSSVAIIGAGLENEKDILSEKIQKHAKDINVKTIDSIVCSVDSADNVSGVDATILAVEVGCTSYTELFEEIESLNGRGIDILGIMIFE